MESVIVLGLPDALARFAERRLELVFRSSRDGLMAKDFHRVCDGLGRTIVLIATPNGCVFGGYSPCVWTPGTGEDDACESFVFSIHNPHNIPAVLPFIDGIAINHDNSTGPIFGENDLVVNDRGVSLRGWRGEAYRNSTDKGNLLFTGTAESEIAEMEVFQVLPG